MRRSRFLTITIVCASIAGCGGGDDSEPRSPAKTPEPEPAAPAPEPLTFGPHRYVSACSVLPVEDVQRIYGPMGPLGYVRQEFYDRSLTEAEFKRKSDTVTGSVQTTCDYNRRDARDMIVHVEVNQYPTEKAARSAWGAIAYLGTGKDSRRLNKMDLSGTGPGFSWDFNFIKKYARENEINMGGKRVKGVDDVLYVRGRADFVGVRGNSLVRLSYLPTGSFGFNTPLFKPRQYRKQAALAKQAFPVIYEQMDRADLDQQPLGPSLTDEQEVNGVPYLDPCSVLNEKIFELATGRPPTDQVTAGVVDQVTADETEADALYVFDSTLKTGAREASRVAFFNVGPYAFMLAVSRNNTLDLYSGKDLDVAGYTKVVDAIAADVRTALAQKP